MRVFRQDSFVLRTIPYSESSLIVDTFTRNHGRVSLLAKGARKVKSRFRGAIQPFQRLLISWSGKGEVPTISNLSEQSDFVRLVGKRLYCCYYLNELVMRTLQKNAPHTDLFDAYSEAIRQLAKPATNEFRVLRIFEKNMLCSLGYALVLETEAGSNTPVQVGKFYRYDIDFGPVRVANGDSEAISGETLLSLSRERFESATVKRESHLLLKKAIENHTHGQINRSRYVYSQLIRNDVYSN